MEPYIEFNGKEVTNPLHRGLLMFGAALVTLLVVAAAVFIPIAIILVILAGVSFLPLLLVVLAFVIVLALPLAIVADRVLKATGRRGFIHSDDGSISINIEREAFEKVD